MTNFTVDQVAVLLLSALGGAAALLFAVCRMETWMEQEHESGPPSQASLPVPGPVARGGSDADVAQATDAASARGEMVRR